MKIKLINILTNEEINVKEFLNDYQDNYLITGRNLFIDEDLNIIIADDCGNYVYYTEGDLKVEIEL